MRGLLQKAEASWFIPAAEWIKQGRNGQGYRGGGPDGEADAIGDAAEAVGEVDGKTVDEAGGEGQGVKQDEVCDVEEHGRAAELFEVGLAAGFRPIEDDQSGADGHGDELQ